MNVPASARQALLPALLIGAFLCAGCGSEEATAPAAEPGFELRDVVRAAIHALEEAHPEPPRVEPADSERVRGLVSLVADPTSGAGGMRAIAIEEAAGLGDACLETLTELVQDSSAPGAEREAAVELLGVLGSLGALGTGGAGDTGHAAQTLLTLVEEAEEPWLRAHAAWRLGDTGADWAVPRLIRRLKYEDDHDTVIWLAETLAALGNFSGLSVLHVVATTSPEPQLRASAAARMQEIGVAAGFEDGYALWNAWDAGLDLEPFRFPHSKRYDLEVWRLLRQFFDFQLRGVDDARYVLQRLDRRAAELMGEALHDQNVYVRVNTAQSLQRMGRRGRPAGATLIEGLAQPDLAPNAAEALGSLAHVAAEGPLRDHLAPGTPPELRLSCARALRGYGLDPGVTAATRAALHGLLAGGEAAELRQAAAESLVALGEGRTVAGDLAAFLTSTAVEPASSERVLRAWLAREAQASEGTGPAAEALARWDALAVPTDRIVATEEKRSAREERRRIVQELARELEQ